MATSFSRGRRFLKTETAVEPRELAENATEPTCRQSDSSLGALLRRPVSVPEGERGAAASPSGGVRLGALRGFDAQGRACVQIDGQARQQTCAGTLVALQPQDIGRRVALGFAGGDTDSPIVLGLLLEAAAVQVSSPQRVNIEQHGERTVIEADEALELRCGEAVILLQADGRIELRGAYITSHASAGQRIRGGSVQIN